MSNSGVQFVTQCSSSGVPQSYILAPTVFLLHLKHTLSLTSNQISSFANNSILHSKPIWGEPGSTENTSIFLTNKQEKKWFELSESRLPKNCLHLSLKVFLHIRRSPHYLQVLYTNLKLCTALTYEELLVSPLLTCWMLFRDCDSSNWLTG